MRIGRARRIDLADLERFIARHRVPERADAGDITGLEGQNEEASR